MQIVQFDSTNYATTPDIVVQWDGFSGASYQCGECYGRSLTAAAPGPGMVMSSPPRTPPPPGTRCYCGKQLA